MYTILVVDDEASIRRILETRLKMVGYDVVTAEDGEEAVEVFNKTNPEYRIVIKEYYTYDTMEDGMAGYNQLNMDILGRGLPDILIADSYFPVSSYISKGLVADIDELIAGDDGTDENHARGDTVNW